MPTGSAPYARVKSPNFWLRERLERRGVGDALAAPRAAVDRELGDQRLAGAGGRRDDHRLARLDGADRPRPGSRRAGTDNRARNRSKRSISCTVTRGTRGGLRSSARPSSRDRLPHRHHGRRRTTSPDAKPHRRAHIERLQGLRAIGILIGGRPLDRRQRAPTSSIACSSPAQLKHAIEEDPYWMGGAWTRYEPRSFTPVRRAVGDGAGRARRLARGHPRRGPGGRARHGAVRADRDARRRSACTSAASSRTAGRWRS